MNTCAFVIEHEADNSWGIMADMSEQEMCDLPEIIGRNATRCNKIARFWWDKRGVWLCAEHYDHVKRIGEW
jgi:hypothetical protein